MKNHINFIIAGILLALCFSECKEQAVSKIDLAASISLPSQIHGIDISKHQGSLIDQIINNDSVSFIFCKATEGKNYVDPSFLHNWEKAKQNDIPRGAYHFYKINRDPIEQAKHFVNMLKGFDKTDLPPVLDIEKDCIPKGFEIDPIQLQQDLLQFLTKVESLTERRPIVYTSLSFANEFLQNDAFSKYPLWLAAYTKKQTPTLPKIWKSTGWTFWQKSGGTDSLHHIATDYDVFNGDLQSLSNFIKMN